MLVDLAPGAAAVTDFVTSVKLPEINDVSTILSFVLLFGLLYAIWKIVGERLKNVVVEAAFSNWRLALLGATGIVLSLASGWTTWDGMRNFTKEPILSFMITFGIQGVMLIVAWFIGESFATGMGQARVVRGANGQMVRRPAGLSAIMPNVTGMVIGTLIFAAIALVVLQSFGVSGNDVGRAETLTGVSDNLLFAAVGLVLVGIIALGAGSDVWSDYARAARVMVSGAVLWIMFLACMATSVFFSFDSLFSTIFPRDERVRAAELRAQNQVAGVVSDIGSIAVATRIEEADRLFTTASWAEYNTELNKVMDLANKAPGAIRRQIERELEEQRQRVAALEEKRADATSGQAGLEARKVQLTEEMSRIRADRPDASANVAEFKTIVGGIEKRLDEQRAFALAEERGVEGSGKEGRGPKWREAKAQERKIQAELEVANRRLKGHRDRLSGIDGRTSSIKAELAQIDADLAKLRGEAQTAEQLISVTETRGASQAGPQIDPAASVAALEKTRQAFRQNPDEKTLARLQQLCLGLQNAGRKVASLRNQAERVDCDPGTASEAAARVFALNTGIVALQANCIGGDKLPQTGGADALFDFARGCVQDSGLPSDATGELRTRINSLELNRDDKAHRFVVTSNAFQDGNKLAYLALAIAIAIDALVFMSGLFGANAMKSPLTDVPSHKGRSAKQLEDIVENALLPHKFENATLALEHIHPVSRQMYDDPAGWTHEVVIPYTETAQRARLLKVMNAGATIGAVTRDPEHPERYFVRGEFVEFLAVVAKKAFETDHSNVKLAELKKILIVALQPHVGDHADVVLGYLTPISERDGFSSEVCLNRDISDAGHRFIVQKAANAGTTLDYIQRDDREGEEDRFYIHRDFYRTLAIIASEFPKRGHVAAHPHLTGRELITDAVEDGVATEIDGHAVERITDQSERGGDKLNAFVISEFLRAIRIDRTAYDWAIENRAEARLANSSIVRLIEMSPLLAARVRQARDTRIDTLGDKQSALEKSFEDLRDQHPMITDVRREIEELLPLMLLAPGGAYREILTELIEEMRAGHDSGPLPETQQRDLDRLIEHRGELESGNARRIIQAMASLMSEEGSETNVTQLPRRSAAGEA